MNIRRLLPLPLLLLALPAFAQEAPTTESRADVNRQPVAIRPSCLTPLLLDQQADRYGESRAPANEIESGAGRGATPRRHPEIPRDLAPGADKDDTAEEDALGSLPVTRESRQKELVTPQGHFRIHYDVSGINGVATRDRDANGVPDYIDSTAYYLEFAWRVEIDEMGYIAPTDNGIEGPEVDVLVSELSASAYGYAYPEFENEISSEPLRVTGFLVIDNDYVGFPTPGIAGLRVTTAHEFHHIVQFSSYRVETSQAALYEATSTWFEKVVHPSIMDYRNYTDVLLGEPQNCPFSTHDVSNLGIGYGHILYFDYLSERIDRDVVRRIWEEFAKDERSFTAIDRAIRATSLLDLQQSWCEFSRWCYFTGERALADSSFLDEAKFLPTMRNAIQKSLESTSSVNLDGILRPLAFTIERVRILGEAPGSIDSIDFLIANCRSDIGKGGRSVPAETFTLRVSTAAEPGYLPIERNGTTVAYYRFASNAPSYCITPILSGAKQVSAVEEEEELAPGATRTASETQRSHSPSLNLRNP